MIVDSSRPRLSPCAHRIENRIVDRASGRTVVLNDTARHILDGIDGTKSVGEIASGLSERFGIHERTALEDTRELLYALRSGGLVRTRPTWRYRLAYLAVTMRTSNISVLREGLFARKRVDVPGANFLGIFVRIAFHTSARYWWMVAYLVLLGGGVPLLLLGGGAGRMLLAPLILCSVLLLGVSLHESAHLYVLRRRTANPWLGYLSFSSIKVGIRRPRIERRELDHEVAVSGPLCPVVCGVALSTLNAVHPSFILAASGLLLTVHALSLLPPSSDGKKLFLYAFALPRTEASHEP